MESQSIREEVPALRIRARLRGNEGRQLGEDSQTAAERRRRTAIRRRNATFRRLLAVSDVTVGVVVLFASALLHGDNSLRLATLGGVALLLIVIKAVGLYDRDENLIHKTTVAELPALFEVATLSALLLWVLGSELVAGDLGRRQVLGIWLLLFVLWALGRAAARLIAGKVTPAERVLVLGDTHSAAALSRKLNLTGSIRAELVGWLPLTKFPGANGHSVARGLPGALDRVLAEQQIHRVVLAPGRVDTESLLGVICRLQGYHVAVSVMPATPPVGASSMEMDDIHGLTLLGVPAYELGRSSRLLKRLFDLVLSAAMLIVLLPLMLLTALAIRLDSRGPVFFRQQRVGRDGRTFKMLKFRSMTPDAEEHLEELRHLNEIEGMFKMEHDPRVTRVGRIIRRWSLDELPQLFNVLRGEMSLVGPRPLVLEEDSRIEGHFRQRLDLAPGITGVWQSLGAGRIPLDEMVRLDFLYVADWSLWHDVRILLRTLPYVLEGRSR